MKTFVNKVVGFFSYISKQDFFMELVNIKSIYGSIVCEFNEKLSTNGKLTKIEVHEIFSNKNLQSCISSENLLLIGEIYGENKDVEKKYKIKNIDLIDESLIIMNKNSRIKISFRELINDQHLLEEIRSVDVFKWAYQYAYKEGYESYKKIHTASDQQSEENIQDHKVIKFSTNRKNELNHK